MRMLNRSALIVRPTTLFVDWLHGLPDESNRELSLDDLRRENTVYLLDEVDTLEQAIEQITPFVEDIFAEEVGGWWTVEKDWPTPLSIKKFLKWFDLELNTVLADVGTDGLRVEEL